MYRQKQAPPQEANVLLRPVVLNTGSPAFPASTAQEPVMRLKGDPASIKATAYMVPDIVFERHMHYFE